MRKAKIPRKLKKKLKKQYGDGWKRNFNFGRFSYPPLFFGGRRSYLMQKYINGYFLNHYYRNSGIEERITEVEAQWNFQAFPGELNNYFEAIAALIPKEPKIKRIEDFLCPKLDKKIFPIIKWEQPVFIDFWEKEYAKVQGLSADHLLIEDFNNIENNG